MVRARAEILFLEYIEHRQGRLARQRIARKRSAQTAGAGSIHDFGASCDRGQRQTAADRFGRDENVRLNAVALAGEHRARAGESGLHFVGDEQHAVLAANIDQGAEELRRRRDKSAFPEDRLDDHSRHALLRHHALERVFQVPRAE